ncbi:MAG: DUF1858 domain-containing protein [Bacillota bacterium]
MINKDMSILDILQAYPQTMEVFIKHGMGCIQCMGANEETLVSAARIHGIDVQTLLDDLNKAVGKE